MTFLLDGNSLLSCYQDQFDKHHPLWGRAIVSVTYRFIRGQGNKHGNNWTVENFYSINNWMPFTHTFTNLGL